MRTLSPYFVIHMLEPLPFITDIFVKTFFFVFYRSSQIKFYLGFSPSNFLSA